MSKLIVSEPWDFESPQGGNELHGKVLKRLDSKTLIFETEENISFKGLSSRYWFLSTRYEKQSFESEPYQGTVNGSLLPALPQEGDSLASIRKSATFVIIGSLHPE